MPPHWTTRRAHNGTHSIDFQRVLLRAARLLAADGLVLGMVGAAIRASVGRFR